MNDDSISYRTQAQKDAQKYSAPGINAQPERSASNNLEAFITQPTFILQTKLEVLAGEINERLRLRGENLHRIDNDQTKAYEMLKKLAYRMADSREMSGLYQQVFQLQKERRESDVECWRDVVMVMREFLTIWGAWKEATLSIKLFNAGTRS